MKTLTARKSVAVTSLLAVILVSAWATQKKTSLGRENVTSSKSDDATLAANLNAELSKRLKSNVMQSINYSVKNGVVTLTGKTNFDGTRQYAGEIVKQVGHVKNVVNNIEVTTAPNPCSVGDKWCCCDLGACECLNVRVCPVCRSAQK
jgi:osmotically-inducible protein OsmY